MHRLLLRMLLQPYLLSRQQGCLSVLLQNILGHCRLLCGTLLHRLHLLRHLLLQRLLEPQALSGHF